jgi:ribonuclease HI
MELMAVIEAMEAVNSVPGWKEAQVAVHSDSQYVINAFNEGWISGWIRRGWRTANGPVKNPDLWKRLLGLVEGRDVRYVWVKGHSGDPVNEACDRLAVEQAAFACSQTAPWVSAGNPATAAAAPGGPAETAKACPDFAGGYEACRQELFRFLHNLQPGTPPPSGDHFDDCRREVREFLDRMSPGDGLPF